MKNFLNKRNHGLQLLCAGMLMSLGAPLAQAQDSLLPLLDRHARKPSVADVGDVDSFGRALKWSGAKSGRYIQFKSDCGTPAVAGCYLLPALNEQITIDEQDVVSFRLPARTAHSLVCPVVDQRRYHYLSNQYPAPGVTVVNLGLSPEFVLESSALVGVVNTLTGETLDGRLVLGQQLYDINRVVSQTDLVNDTTSSFCSDGSLSKAGLRSMGIPERAADRVFAEPMTLRMNVKGIMRNVADGLYGYRVRLLTD